MEQLTARDAITSLFPLELTYECQHKALLLVQGALEKALYEFGAQYIRDVMKGRQWDCAQCVELNDWAKILRKNKHKFPGSNVQQLRRPLDAILQSAIQIRHTVVHRKRVSADRIKTYLEDAECLAGLVGANDRSQEITQIKQETLSFIANQTLLAENLQVRMMALSNETYAQCLALREKEHFAVSRALKEQDEANALASETFQCNLSNFEKASDSSPKTDCAEHSTHPTVNVCSDCMEQFRKTIESECDMYVDSAQIPTVY